MGKRPVDWSSDDPAQTCTVAEAADYTRKSASTLNRAMNDGYLPYVMLNGHRSRRTLRVVDVRRWVTGG